MPQIMPQPWKHPKLGTYYFRKVVPAHLRATLGKTEIRVPLSRDLREAKLKYPEVAARVDSDLARAAGGPVTLSPRQIVALAGLWYRREVDASDEQLEPPEVYESHLEALQGETEVEDPEAIDVEKARGMVADDVASLLSREALVVTQQSREELADRLFWLKVDALNALRRRAGGDYKPDGEVDAFPAWEAPQAAAAPIRKNVAGLTFTMLLEAWKAERKPAPKTAYEWERVIGLLETHVGHDAPTRLVKVDIVGWKDALLSTGKSAKTVSNHLLAANALFNWAVDNERMRENPAKGVTVAGKGKAKAATKRLPYTDEDAKTLLLAARTGEGARRWVPWLLAFTGARLEEICQALVADVRKDGAVHYIDINEDDPGKSLKNQGSARRVPLHPAVISEGFLEYVKGLPKDGPLFPDMAPDIFGRRGGNATKIIGRWVRKQGITDPRKAPNHSWRHRFKDECRNAGIAKEVHDALTGHASDDEGDKYGLGYSLPVLAAAVAKLPTPVTG